MTTFGSLTSRSYSSHSAFKKQGATSATENGRVDLRPDASSHQPRSTASKRLRRRSLRAPEEPPLSPEMLTISQPLQPVFERLSLTPPTSPVAINAPGRHGRRTPMTSGSCLSPAKEVDEEGGASSADDEQEILDEAHSPTPVPRSQTPPTWETPSFTAAQSIVVDSSESRAAAPTSTSDTPSPTSDRGTFGRGSPLPTELAEAFTHRSLPAVPTHSDVEAAVIDDFDDGPSVILVAQRVSRANSSTSPTSPESPAEGGRVFAPARRGSISSVGGISRYSSLRSVSERSSFASANSTGSAHSSSNSVTSQGFANMLSRYVPA
jgi:hypothetical protein